jgi:NADH-quinone oxidoreductase subunit N
MALFMVSLAGMPPTAGFIAKFWVLRAVVAAGGVWLAVVAVVATVVSFAYYLRVAAHLFMRSREGAEPVAVDPNAGWAVALCAIFTLMLGVWPALYGVRAVEAAARALF